MIKNSELVLLAREPQRISLCQRGGNTPEPDREVLMARIFYSMAGEGRGHAARVKTLVEQFVPEHEFWLFAPDDAYDFLAPAWAHTDLPIRLVRIPGLRFVYRNGNLDLNRTIACGLKYAACELPKVVRALRRQIQAIRPDLAISDFDPALPRAACAEGVPLVAFDHQHVLAAYDLAALPTDLQRHAWWMSWVVWWCYPGPHDVIASAFYAPPLKSGWKHVRQVGPMIRSDVARLQPREGGYLVSYLRRATPPSVIEALKTVDREVRVYGLGARPAKGNLRFCAIDERQFVVDLAGCNAVVCAAGNQLIGEAIYLGKPVLALPEPSHHEQLINSHYLRKMGVGDFATLDAVTPGLLSAFRERRPEFRRELERYRGVWNGTPTAAAAVRARLEQIAACAAQTVQVAAGSTLKRRAAAALDDLCSDQRA